MAWKKEATADQKILKNLEFERNNAKIQKIIECVAPLFEAIRSFPQHGLVENYRGHPPSEKSDGGRRGRYDAETAVNMTNFVQWVS